MKSYMSPPSDDTQSHGFVSNFINLVPEEGSTFSDNKGTINVLILGVDKNWTQDNIMYTKDVRTDTMMVASLNLEKKTVGLLSIPRDSYVSIPGEYEEEEWSEDYEYDDLSTESYEYETGEEYRGGYEGKINGANALGGVKLAIRAVEEVLQIHIDYYILVKVNALPDLIDAVGGVEVYVEKDMDYDDNWGHLHIHLKEGWQTLDGDRAEQYSRFRNDEEGDLGRIRRQQQILYAIKNKVGETKNILQIKRIIEATYKNVETDLSPGQILDLANIYKNVGKDDIRMATIPTYSDSFNEISYQIIDYYVLPDYVNEYLLGIPPPLTVEIVNGNDGYDYSYDAEEKLTAFGFKVVNVRDDGYVYDDTHIIINTDKVDLDNMSVLVKILGNPQVYEVKETGEEENGLAEDGSPVDITVILGTDYTGDETLGNFQ